MSIWATLQALISLIPIIKQLLALFTKTPAEKRDQLVTDLHSAFAKAETDNDTSDLEALIRRGK